MAMNRSIVKIAAVVAVAAALSACGDQKPAASNPANMPVPVNLYEVQPERALYYDKFPGTVTALMQVDIRAVTEGYVTGIFFKEGEHVKKGQRLYSIDDSKYRASVNQAHANVEVAQSNLDQAQKDADRYIYLNQHDAVAKQILDHATTTLQNAKNQLTAAKQDLVKAQTDLKYAIITAPFDGTIGISQVKLGNTIVPGQTVMNTISTDDPMAADFLINEKQIPRFNALQRGNFNAADSIFTMLMPDGSLYPQPGKISVIDRGVNPQTGAITVRLVFANPASMLKSGMSCTVRVKNTDTSAQVLIPAKAIVEQMGEYFVYVAKDTAIAAPSGKDDKQPAQAATVSPHALQRKVTLGQAIADRVIVLSGVEPGDKVIVDGVQKLHDGSAIKPGGGAPHGAPAGK